MNYLGDFADDATVYIPFNTFDSNDPSASVTITDLAQGDVEIWKNGVVQTTPGAGVTLTLNIGANNGSHLIAVDTSNTDDIGWFATGNDYQARINGTTVDGATINSWVGSFSIENRFMRGTDSALLAASVNIADGAIKSDLTHIHGTALTETAGQLAAAFKKLFDVGTPLLVASDVMVGTDDGALASVLGSAVGASISADIADLPTVAEFEARTIVSDDYVVVGDTIAAVTLVNGLAANVITAASINADAITNAKIADDAIAAENLATDAISADALSSGAVDEIWAKVMSDLASMPAADASVLDAINIIFMSLRNKQTATSSAQTIANDAGATIATASLSDAAGTTTKEEYA